LQNEKLEVFSFNTAKQKQPGGLDSDGQGTNTRNVELRLGKQAKASSRPKTDQLASYSGIAKDAVFCNTALIGGTANGETTYKTTFKWE
jgi:hypothetical protein